MRNMEGISLSIIIPARGGSKGIRFKNVAEVNGKPLLWYTIEAAKKICAPERIFVNTDSGLISSYAKEQNVQVYARAHELAGDEASIQDVLFDQVSNLDSQYVGYMQPTDIFRTVPQMRQAVMAVSGGFDSSFVAKKTHKKYWAEESETYFRVNSEIYESRQSAKSVLYREDTGLFLVSNRAVFESGRRIGDNVFIIKNEDSFSDIDIHDHQDIALAEAAIDYSKIFKKRYYAFQ